jgi:hypothetical protein
MKGMAVEQVMLIFLCVAFVFGILIWFWQAYVKGSGTFTKAECETARALHCNEWKVADYPTRSNGMTMHTRVFCKNGSPVGCGCVVGQDGYKEFDLYVEQGGNNWWDCIAPSCTSSYGIKIYGQNDCQLP